MSDARTPAKRTLADRLLLGPAAALLALALFGMVNYLASRHYRRWDLTAARSFTLSPRTQEIVRALRSPVDVYVLVARDEPLYRETSELAERYGALSTKVQVHYIDPDRQRERLLGLAQRLGLELVQSSGGERTLSTAALVVARASRHWEVSRESMHELGAPEPGDESGSARLLNARITVERAVSEAILQVDRERPTKLCVTTGHAEMAVSSGNREGAGFADDLRHHNFIVQEVEVRGQTELPRTCDAVLVLGPERSWAPEEAAALERYLRAGGNAALYLDPVLVESRVAPTGLEGVARLAGVELPAALVVEGASDHLLPESPPLRFRADTWSDHEVTTNLRGTSVLATTVRPLTRAEGAQVVPIALLQSTPEAWGETAIAELLRTQSPERQGDDLRGPIALAMAAELAGVNRPTPGQAAGRLVVVGSSELVNPRFFSLEARVGPTNADFAEAVVGWLTARRELVNIPGRPADRASMMVSDQDLGGIALYVILLVPLAAALVGVAVWRARKSVQ